MNASKTKVITKSTEGLRNTLLETLEQFVNGEVDHIYAKTVAKLCDSVNKNLALDLEASRFVRETGQQALADLKLNTALVSPALAISK